jgi:hypothetical protein
MAMAGSSEEASAIRAVDESRAKRGRLAANPASKKIGSTNGQAGAVRYHITGNGDAFVFPTGEPQHGRYLFGPAAAKVVERQMRVV